MVGFWSLRSATKALGWSVGRYGWVVRLSAVKRLMEEFDLNAKFCPFGLRIGRQNSKCSTPMSRSVF